ncbi:MAG: leucine-rich repeat domain-containing protein [Ruminococcus sp.]|nr:leucine-rich repeat domain-containing protein [Ruminococcus sp.]HRR76154.1 leucine-rich repeat domain-containing protein [Ruminococcus sp.]
MKKSIKAIVAATAASIMCAAPAVTPIANVSTTAITASAASSYYDAQGNPTAIPYNISGEAACYITNNNGYIYQITANTRNKHEVQFCGTDHQQTSAVVDNKININGIVYNVTGICDWAFKYQPNNLLRSLDFTKAVQITEIPEWTFCSSSIKSIKLHDHFTYIGDHAFFNADRLTDIQISGDVTEIGMFAFAGCDNLEWVRFVENGQGIDGPYAPLTLDTGAFQQCPSLKKIINNRDISDNSETDAFAKCPSNLIVTTDWQGSAALKQRFVTNFKNFFGLGKK